jgi:hypothetical protein
MDIVRFLQDNNLGIGLIISSIVFPLVVDYVKRRWDKLNWEYRQRAEDIRERQAATLQQRIELLDSLTKCYMAYIIEARFVVLDANLNRLGSPLGKEHRKSYDDQAKSFLRDVEILRLKVGQYFERVDDYSLRMLKLSRWGEAVDGAITSLIELTETDEREECVDERLGHISRALDQLIDAVQETLEQLAMELRPDYVPTKDRRPMEWKHEVDSTTLEGAMYVEPRIVR